MKYVYFVSYHYGMPDGSWGVGRGEVISQDAITSLAHVVYVEQQLNKSYPKFTHIVTSFQLLRLAPENPDGSLPGWPGYASGVEMPVRGETYP